MRRIGEIFTDSLSLPDLPVRARSRVASEQAHRVIG
jgi:hypothetical protein